MAQLCRPFMSMLGIESMSRCVPRGSAGPRFRKFRKNLQCHFGFKDWNDRNKPEEVREKWVEMMNAAIQKAGIDQRLDPRSWAEQGREDLAALQESKTLQGMVRRLSPGHQEIDEQRRHRAKLRARHLDQAAAIQSLE